MDLTRIGAVALHTLAMMIVLGYYGVLGRFVLPALRRTLDPRQAAASLGAIERGARPFLLLSIALFAITGVYLMFIDEQYTGLGDFFGSTWATLVVLKHVVVIVLVGLGVAFDWLVGEVEASEGEATSSLRLAGFAAETVTVLGAIVILLTAAAQLAP